MSESSATPAPSTVTPAPAPAAPAPAPAVAPAAPTPSPAPAAPAAAAPTPAPAAPSPAPAAAAPVVPEKYDFSKVEMPKGIELNADLVTAISPIFQKFGLTQEAASELVKVHAEALHKVEAAAEAKRDADFKDWMAKTVANYQATLRQEWGAETDAKLAVAQAGMAKIVSPAMKAVLDETGLGSHPEFAKAFYQVGMMSREDTPPSAVVPPAGAKSAAQMLYGTTPQQNH